MPDYGSTIEVHHSIASLNASAGGPSVSVVRLCEHLHEIGVCTAIHTLDVEAALGKTALPVRQGIPVYFIPCWVSKRLRISVPFGFGNNLKQNASTAMAFHSHGIWLPVNHITAEFARKTGIPHIISPRGMLEGWSLEYKSLKKKIALSLYQGKDLRTATAFCATSLKEAENIRRLGLEQPIAVIPNGIDIPATPLGRDKKENRKALFISRLHPKKGLLDLIEAWRRLKGQARNGSERWHLTIAGPDEEGYKARIEAAIRNGKLEKDIDVLGPVYGAEKTALLNEANLFILPTYSENFGNVVAEALAAGVPVITTKGAPWRELETNHCGWWTETGVEGCYRAIIQATAISEKERQEMGRRGRTLVETRYSWRSVAESMADFYRWIIRGGERPACVLHPEERAATR